MKDDIQRHMPEGTQADPQMVSAVTTAVLQTLQATGVLPQTAEAPRENKQEPKTIDLIGLFFAVLEKFWLVLICALVCAIGMGWMASISVPSYTATA